MKKQIFLLCFIVMFLTYIGYGQETTYEFLLSSPMNEYLTDIIEDSIGNVYFSGIQINLENPDKDFGLVGKLDKFGNLIDSIIISYPGKSIYIDRILPVDNENFLVIAKIYDTSGEDKNGGIAFYMLDNMLNLSNLTVYYFPSDYINSDKVCAEMCPNGDILVGGEVEIPIGHPRPFIYQFNSDLDSLQAKFYLNELGIVSNLNVLQNGDIWYVDYLRHKFRTIDSALNIKEEIQNPEYLGGNQSAKWDTDTSFYLAGYQLFPSPGEDIGFIKQFYPMDTTGYLHNSWGSPDTIDFPATWGSIDFKNKDSIFIGGIKNMGYFYFDDIPSWYVILQTDSMLNIRWEKFYGGDAYYIMGKIIASNDGGCIVAGTRWDFKHTDELENDIYIVKLNSEGFITSSPEHTTSDKMHEAVVFPNPGTVKMQVRVAVQHLQSTVELYDISGNLVARQDIVGQWGEVNTTFLPQGTYIYRITSSSGLFETGKWVKQ